MRKEKDDRLSEALALVQEARDYMARLPPVPVTLELVRKLSLYLEASPSQNLGSNTLPWYGRAYTPAGQPLIEAMVLDTRLTLREPRAARSSLVTPAEFQRHLSQGITMSLVQSGLFETSDPL